MAVVLGRALYTQHQRSKQQAPFPLASSAIVSDHYRLGSPPSFEESERAASGIEKPDSKEAQEQAQVETIRADAVQAKVPVILPQFITTEPQTLVLSERLPSISDPFDVRNLAGEIVLSIRPETLRPDNNNNSTRSQRKHVYDSQGNALFTIRRDNVSLPRTYYGEDPVGHKVLEIQNKATFSSRSKAEAYFTNFVSNGPAKLCLEGTSKQMTIKDLASGVEAARINRDLWSGQNISGHADKYHVYVAAGVDMSLIVAMCLCLDERKSD